MACGRGDQAIEQVGVFDLIASAERLDHALDVAAALTSVLDEVEIFVGSDLLDSDEHGPIALRPPHRIDQRQVFSITFTAQSGQV